MTEAAPTRADADPELRSLGQALALSQRFHLYLVWWEGDPGQAWIEALRTQVEALRGEPAACRVIAAPQAPIGRALARHAPDLWSVRSGEYLPRGRAATTVVTPTVERVSAPPPRPREDREILLRRVDEARALMRDRPGDDNAVRLLASELEELAKDHLAWRTLASAEEHAREAVMWRRSLVAREPEGAQAQHELCAALIALGDVRRDRGELTGALVLYEEASQIMRWLWSRDQDRPDWRRDAMVL